MAGRTRRVGATPGTALVAVLVAVLGLCVTAAGSCRPDRAEPRPARPTPDRPDGGTGGNQRPEDRHNRLTVLTGQRPQHMEFVDGSTGYVLFTGCPDRCRGALFVTFDGGQSWVERRMPVETADRLQLDVVNATTLVLTAEPGAWFVSRDTGRTFERVDAAPPELYRASGPIQIRCPNGDRCPDQVVRDGVPVPVQPGLPGVLRYATLGGDGRIWVVSTADTGLHTAISTDGGRTWQRFGPPVPADSPGMVAVTVSPDGAEAWLVLGAGAGPVAIHHADAGGWRSVMTSLNLGPGRISVAAVGAGALATASGEFGFVLADGRWWPSDPPRRVSNVAALADGTLVAAAGPDDVWLGTGTGPERHWDHVTVEGG